MNVTVMEKLTDRISTLEGENKCPELLWISPTAHSEDSAGMDSKAEHAKDLCSPQEEWWEHLLSLIPQAEGKSRSALRLREGMSCCPATAEQSA